MIQIYKANHKLPLKSSHRDGKHQAPPLPRKEAKQEESRGLVKMSANYLSLSMNFISISLF
jgi:hypothetical protein